MTKNGQKDHLEFFVAFDMKKPLEISRGLKSNLSK
jgi:hypothetical protein